ncbi:MAG: two-component regulator propeller domain-containing protein [Pyrinomonadaceae bacterium]
MELAAFKMDNLNLSQPTRIVQQRRFIDHRRQGRQSVGGHRKRKSLNVFRDKIHRLPLREGLPADIVRAIYEDHSGRLWFGTHEGGLSVLEKGKFTSLQQKTVWRAMLSSPFTKIGRAVFGSARRTASIATATTGSRFMPRDDERRGDYVRSIYEDRSHRLWIGTRGGLSVMKDGALTSYTVLDGFAIDFVGAVIEDRQSDIWIGTLNGLCRCAMISLRSTPREGLSSNVVTTALCRGGNGGLWVGTKRRRP